MSITGPREYISPGDVLSLFDQDRLMVDDKMIQIAILRTLMSIERYQRGGILDGFSIGEDRIVESDEKPLVMDPTGKSVWK